ncbi:hypothetical protein D3C87_41460 [compost metagenome]
MAYEKKLLMKRLITPLFVLSICFVQAQSFDHIVYKQAVLPVYKQAIEQHDFANSVQQLNAAKTRFGKLYGEEYLLMSYCYKGMGNDSLAAAYVKEACSVPSFDMRVTWYLPDLFIGNIVKDFSEQNLKLRDEGFDNSWKRRPKNADSLTAVIDSMTYWDQFYRNQWLDDKENPVFIAQLDSMNRRNEQLLEEMVRKIGFPGEGKLQLGEFCVWFVLVHTAGNEAFYQRMKPVFLNEVRIGNMSPWMYASWVDQHQFYNKLPTLYNTQVGFKTDFTKKEQEEISRNRFEIGLVDLQYVNSH